MINWLSRIWKEDEQRLSSRSSNLVEIPRLQPGTSMFNGQEVEIKEVELEREYHVEKGDTFRLSIYDEGHLVMTTEDEITKKMLINRCAVFRVENELGFKEAIACAFGEKQ